MQCLDLLKEKLSKDEAITRNNIILKTAKWTEFKERRAKIIDIYLKQKRKSKSLE